jgi:hypothetical protein
MGMKQVGSKGPPWEVDVDVYVYAEDHDPPFLIESYLQTAQNGNLQFHNRGRDGFNVRFTLHDLSNQGYQWPRPNEVAQALRSQQGEGCPPANCGHWDQFEPKSIIHNRKVLIVRNLNEYEAKFGYTLRITKDDGATYRELDPGGDNWNGNFAAFF